jgi:hypothetical protein
MLFWMNLQVLYMKKWVHVCSYDASVKINFITMVHVGFLIFESSIKGTFVMEISMKKNVLHLCYV